MSFDFVPLHSLLPKIIRKKELEPQFTGALMCHHFRKIVLDLWGEEALSFVCPISFKKGVLHVEVSTSAWAQQLEFKKRFLEEQLSVLCPSHAIQKWFIRINSTLSRPQNPFST
ncbi:MAG: hypothetical protein ACD_28C00099G0002 [uncultured bacterium]|nr:MAG: hypothetical protein ACD_28C00099G0002 [uncultured bacterium]KKT72775.1 MAG: hypothetical protein UW70_C0100G0005 [Candidatus Peregrinibacteria bacterium GW2011_GWA2_44_7]